MTRGIILLVLGHRSYGQWAYNLATSIRAFSDIPIQLLHDKTAISHLAYWQLEKFNIRTEIKHEDSWSEVKAGNVTGEKFNPAKAKLSLNKYLAFDKAIYLDVDAICVRNPEEIFDRCTKFYESEVIGREDFNRSSFGNNMYWANPSSILKYYPELKDEILPFINSSFQYMENGEKLDKLYAQAKKNLLQNPIQVADLKEVWGKKGTGQPDELYMNLALCQVDHDARSSVAPVFFCTINQPRPNFDKITEKHWFIGYYGDKNTSNRHVKGMYDKLMQKYCKNNDEMQQIKFHDVIEHKYMIR